MAIKNMALSPLVTEYDDNGDPVTPGITKIEQVRDEPLPILKGWEAVRMRPGMYIGDVGTRGLHHMFKEIVDNAVDEVLAGHCTEIDVVLGDDYTITVSDNGRGIPVNIIEGTDKTGVELVFTDIHASRKLRDYSHRVFGGLHGIGASAVNALSEWLRCDVKCGGKVYRMRFKRGVPVTALETVADCGLEEQGTTVTWLADKMIFLPALTDSGDLAYDSELIADRCRELAYHLSDARITFQDRLHTKPLETFHFPNGVADYVRDLNRGRTVFPAEPIAFHGVIGDTLIEVALQYSDADCEAVLGFANMIPTPENGTHITGFRRALTKAVNGFDKERTKHGGGITRRGLTAVVSVQMPYLSWGGSSKVRVMNPELEGIVFSMVYAGLKKHWTQYPEQWREVVEQVVSRSRISA
ncbi:MAG: hypothetical protein H8F28_18510 [Fibrella sp.]|nr:hypothetical protein [Armatimonadota bacterium]